MTKAKREYYGNVVPLKGGEPAHVIAAFNELLALGAPVYGHKDYHGAHFTIGGELRTSEDHYFCDYYGEELREHFHPDDMHLPVSERRIENPFGIRTDVNAILTKHNLYAEWINPGEVGVYDI